MQDRIWTIHLGRHVGERVTLAGWLHRLRRLSGVSFLILRDRTGTAQVVIEDPAILDLLDGCQHETVLCVSGEVVQEAQAPGGVEIRHPAIEIVTPVADPPPIELFRPVVQAQLPTVLDHAAVALRHPRHQAIFRLASAAMDGYRRTLRAEGFTEIQTPKIVVSATESGANVFEIDYFGRPAYLAQSPQFYKQMMVGVFERVFEVGPVFRAEPHATARHVNEYVSLDFEMGFIRDHHDVMAMLTRALGGMIGAIREDAADAAALLKLALPDVPPVIPEIAFSDALDLIWRETGEDARGEPDLAPAHERFLSAWAQREYGSDFLFVTGYPMVKRPFYTHPDPARPAYSNSFDLLFRGLELVTGGQRLHRYADYLAALDARRMTPDSLTGYLEAFRYGMPPHGGCAIGLERWVAQLAGLDNIREATLFPRDLHRLTP
ncbi:MAG: aspartate--tRNA(Asn) ligase [Anaerolineae bacterium]|nr:aspartate--tRNA(Asn) ligase [Anaerolineae bacterium]